VAHVLYASICPVRKMMNTHKQVPCPFSWQFFNHSQLGKYDVAFEQLLSAHWDTLINHLLTKTVYHLSVVTYILHVRRGTSFGWILPKAYKIRVIMLLSYVAQWFCSMRHLSNKWLPGKSGNITDQLYRYHRIVLKLSEIIKELEGKALCSFSCYLKKHTKVNN